MAHPIVASMLLIPSPGQHALRQHCLCHLPQVLLNAVMSGCGSVLGQQLPLADPGPDKMWPCGPQVMEVQPEVRLCTVTEGLTEDAVSARLFQGKQLSS